VLLWGKTGLGDNAGFTAAIREVGSGVLQRHAARQVVDGGRCDIWQQADAPH
jgi:hypothetical protein